MFAISLFAPLREGCGPSIELTWNPFTQSCFVQVWLKFDKRIFKFRQCIFAISLLSPLMKGATLRIFFAQECFVRSVVEIDPVVLEKKMKIWKLTDRWTYIQTDRRKLTGDRKSSLELSAKLSKNPKLQIARTVDIRINNKTVVEETV